jgi:hypothetical protein
MLRRSSALGLRKIPVGAKAPLWDFSPPHFCKPWKPTVSFIGLSKRRKQPERYVPLGLKIILTII